SHGAVARGVVDDDDRRLLRERAQAVQRAQDPCTAIARDDDDRHAWIRHRRACLPVRSTAKRGSTGLARLATAAWLACSASTASSTTPRPRWSWTARSWPPRRRNGSR